jgi:2'-5' RNA ligase
MSDEHERARLFVALELPFETRRTLDDWRAWALAGRSELRLTAPEGLHVTLCFLGSRGVDEIAPIATACDAVAGMAVAELVIGKPIWLPPRRPGVVAVELEDSGGALASVRDTLSRVLESGEWYVPEKRPFRAHVTVARVRKGARVRRHELPSPPADALRASTVTLYRSRLRLDGARYEPLASWDLGVAMRD